MSTNVNKIYPEWDIGLEKTLSNMLASWACYWKYHEILHQMDLRLETSKILQLA